MPDESAELDRLERALSRLHELNVVLARYEGELRWAPGDESLDSTSVIRHAEAHRQASQARPLALAARHR